jgi:spore maturation protein SpmB
VKTSGEAPTVGVVTVTVMVIGLPSGSVAVMLKSTASGLAAWGMAVKLAMFGAWFTAPGVAVVNVAIAPNPALPAELIGTTSAE